MVCCVCGLEIHIGHKHSSNRTCIDSVSLRLSETVAFPVEIGVKRIQDECVQTVVEKEFEDVVAVLSSSLKPNFYVVSRLRAVTNSPQQGLEAVSIVCNGEHISQHFTF